VRWDRREGGAGCEVETGSWGGASEPVLVLTIVTDMATAPDAWLLPEMSDDIWAVDSLTEAEDSDGWVNVV
jgi:hypothetical protein